MAENFSNGFNHQHSFWMSGHTFLSYYHNILLSLKKYAIKETKRLTGGENDVDVRGGHQSKDLSGRLRSLSGGSQRLPGQSSSRGLNCDPGGVYETVAQFAALTKHRLVLGASSSPVYISKIRVV